MLLNSGAAPLGSSSSSVGGSSVLSICGRRRTGQRRVNVQYILDLLAFAVETGRLTEACADAVKHIIQNPSDDDCCLPYVAAERRESVAAERRESVAAERRENVAAERRENVAVTSRLAVTSRTAVPPHVDEETVLREVRFRKTYHGLQRTTPSGFNPYDNITKATLRSAAAGGEAPSSSAFEITTTTPGSSEIFGDFDTLEDLLAKLELCRGTPVESIKQQVRVKRELVGHLILRRGGARPNVYKRLARALDQRVPPDQRLLSTTQVRKQAAKVDAAPTNAQQLPSCWHRKTAPAGSQLFRTPTKLSDFMIQNDQS